MSNEVSKFTPEQREYAEALLIRAENGDESTLPVLREWLQDPHMIRLMGGDLALKVEQELVIRTAGKNLVLREALLRKLELLRSELGGPSPTPLEGLLVERVVTCWLHLHDIQIRFVYAKDLSIYQDDYHHRALDRCHRRYLSAIKMLAVVRRLVLPVLRVSFSEKPSQHNGTNGACRKAEEDRFLGRAADRVKAGP